MAFPEHNFEFSVLAKSTNLGAESGLNSKMAICTYIGNTQDTADLCLCLKISQGEPIITWG